VQKVYIIISYCRDPLNDIGYRVLSSSTTSIMSGGEKSSKMHEYPSSPTNKEQHLGGGSLLKKKQGEWAQDEEYSEQWFPFGSSRTAASNKKCEPNDPHASDANTALFSNETKQEADVSRLRRKLESSIGQLETALGLVNRDNSDAMKKIEKNRNEIHELQRQVEVEQHNHEDILEQYQHMKKRATELQSKKEELIVAMDEAIRSGQQAGRDAHQSVSRCDGLTAEAHSLSAIGHKVDNELVEIHKYLDQNINELKSCEKRSKVAMAHAATLFEQIRHEEQSVMQSDHMRKSLEARIKEMQARLDEVEAAALKGDNKLIDAFESRIHEMEDELGSEQRRYEDANKKLSEHDRRVRELRHQVDEDKKEAERARDLIDKLQKKLSMQEKAIENAKLHQMQHVAEADGRADHAKDSVSKMRAQNR
uniref:Myosin tail domain-containing protein n=2 Tax=Parascaris univalens TaxID=6257 RepID=A0A915AUR7_PARUN